MKHIPTESLYAALDSIEKSVVKGERRYRMTLIELIEARRNLQYRCKELFTDEKIAEQIYRYLCEGLEECENKKDTLAEAQRAYEQGVKDTLDKYDETCRMVSEIRMTVGCKTTKECRELIRNGEIQRVRHGRWVDGKCSVCGEHALYWMMSSGYYASPYCPNCGASMDLEGDTE